MIADVGESLLKLLRGALVPELIAHPDGIGLAHPADKGDLQLSVFLYHIKENTESRNRDMINKGVGDLQYPPIALDLSYLITAHSASDLLSRGIDEHRIMGRTLQLMFDSPILRGADLLGSLAQSEQSMRIVKEEVPLETILHFFPDTPYRLSLCYNVGPVLLASTRTRSVSRVAERKIKLQEK